MEKSTHLNTQLPPSLSMTHRSEYLINTNSTNEKHPFLHIKTDLSKDLLFIEALINVF